MSEGGHIRLHNPPTSGYTTHPHPATQPTLPGCSLTEEMPRCACQGNFLEYESLQAFARASQPAKNVVYGATELVTGREFLEQLSELGRKTAMG